MDPVELSPFPSLVREIVEENVQAGAFRYSWPPSKPQIKGLEENHEERDCPEISSGALPLLSMGYLAVILPINVIAGGPGFAALQTKFASLTSRSILDLHMSAMRVTRPDAWRTFRQLIPGHQNETSANRSPTSAPKLSGGTQIRRGIGFDLLKFFGGEVCASVRGTRAGCCLGWASRSRKGCGLFRSGAFAWSAARRFVPTFRRWVCRTRQNKDAGPGDLRVRSPPHTRPSASSTARL
jgi:hypothetical protein